MTKLANAVEYTDIDVMDIIQWYNIFQEVEKRERVGTLDGLKFFIYPGEFSGKHHLPHLQVIFAEFNAQIDILNLKIIIGNIPPMNRKAALRWVEENQVRLLEKFNSLNNTAFTTRK